MDGSYTAQALGAVIRELRERHDPPLSQDELGRQANYGAGRGVSISRIEAGANRPNARRFHDIARALNVDAEQLARLARERSDLEPERAGSNNSSGSRRHGAAQRLQAVQSTVKARTDTIDALASAFNAANDRAEQDFLLPFLAVLARIEHAPTSAPLARAHQRIAVGAERSGDTTSPTVDSAAEPAKGHRPALLAGLVASSGLSAPSARLLLLGLVAAPLSILAAGGLLFLARRRSKREEEELSVQLDESEQALAATQHGFDALADVLPRATAILDYIGVHAAHALSRWTAGLESGAVTWADLTSGQQERCRDFIAIAERQLSLDAIDASAFVTTAGPALDRLVGETGGVLADADRTVRALV